MFTDDPLVGLIRHSGLNPRSISLRQVIDLVNAEARGQRGIAMAAVKLGKAEMLVTHEEALAALAHPETRDNEILSGETLRAGENAYLRTLVEYGFHDPKIAGLRIDTNVDLDKGEVTAMSMRSPTSKRPSGRPSRSEDFRKVFAMDAEFRRAGGEASSREKVVEMLTGRDRDGRPIPGATPLIVLPAGMKSHFTVHAMLRWADEHAPALVEEARRQGETANAGGTPDAAFMARLAEVRSILANPAAVQQMLKADRRKNRDK